MAKEDVLIISVVGSCNVVCNFNTLRKRTIIVKEDDIPLISFNEFTNDLKLISSDSQQGILQGYPGRVDGDLYNLFDMFCNDQSDDFVFKARNNICKKYNFLCDSDNNIKKEYVLDNRIDLNTILPKFNVKKIFVICCCDDWDQC